MGLTSPSRRWSAWGPLPFAQATEEGKPVLLAIGTSWSLGTRTMAETTYRDDVVAELIDAHFVPVWVDADDRPDVAERYGLGGWPTTAFLTADGRTLGGQTSTTASDMVELLRRVTAAFEQRRAELTRSVSPDAPPAPARPAPGSRAVDARVEPWVMHHLQEAYDPECGGFGRGRKRLDEAALLFALRCADQGHTALRSISAHTLDRAAALLDEIDGGVFHYAQARDWSRPSVEKLATVNAAALQVLSEGWRVLREPSLRDRVWSIAGYVDRTLGAAAGFYSSQAADPGYYAAGTRDRPGVEPPPVDRTVYVHASAELARALMQAGVRLDDGSLIERGVARLDPLVSDVCRPGEGVPHTAGQPGGGLLTDQVSVAAALVTAGEVTGGDAYLDLAQELMLHALRVLWSDEHGVFVDRVVHPDDVGLLRRTMTPFAPNCQAARVLFAIGRRAGRPDLIDRANAALSGQTASVRRRSIDAAHYALALIGGRDVDGLDEAS